MAHFEQKVVMPLKLEGKSKLRIMNNTDRMP